VAAVAAGLTAWLVHASIDWDWQMPALTGAAIALAATVVPGARRGRPRRAEATAAASTAPAGAMPAQAASSSV
jgi:hypothetical protein